MENGGRVSHWMDKVIASKLSSGISYCGKPLAMMFEASLSIRTICRHVMGCRRLYFVIEGKPGLALPHATCRIVTP